MFISETFFAFCCFDFFPSIAENYARWSLQPLSLLKKKKKESWPREREDVEGEKMEEKRSTQSVWWNASMKKEAEQHVLCMVEGSYNCLLCCCVGFFTGRPLIIFFQILEMFVFFYFIWRVKRGKRGEICGDPLLFQWVRKFYSDTMLSICR